MEDISEHAEVGKESSRRENSEVEREKMNFDYLHGFLLFIICLLFLGFAILKGNEDAYRDKEIYINACMKNQQIKELHHVHEYRSDLCNAMYLGHTE